MNDVSPVKIVPCDPRWPLQFAEEQRLLAAALAPAAVTIEHIGSTAVTGLAAKPIIDIMLGVGRLSEIESLRPNIEALGYEYAPEFEIRMPERRLFRKPRAGERTHHLHAVELGGEFWTSQIKFRDYLRVHPEAAADYARLKRELAAKFAGDRASYTTAKSEFIEAILAIKENS